MLMGIQKLLIGDRHRRRAGPTVGQREYTLNRDEAVISVTNRVKRL
jgi:hypothetical protein